MQQAQNHKMSSTSLFLHSFSETFLKSELFQTFSTKCNVKPMSTLTSSEHLVSQKHGRLACNCEGLASSAGKGVFLWIVRTVLKLSKITHQWRD